MANPSESERLVGQLLDGRYQVIREIAVGGMSVVYEATHVKIGRTVAIKVLHRDMAGDPELVERFINEARAVGTFGHPNIVASTDYGELPGHVPYLVLEYLRGHTLSDEIASDGPLSVRRSARIGIQIASALDAAHMREVIHRDLTSANIFLTQSKGNPDHVKVLDFGISKFLSASETAPKTRRGLTMGTPEFMSPEQISDPQAIDARVDVYALGVILYHMLAGKPPFTRMPLQSLLTQIVLEPPPPLDRPGIPEEITAIVMRALAKAPADRFSTMRQLGTELERFGSRTFSSGFIPGIMGQAEEWARPVSVPNPPVQVSPTPVDPPTTLPPTTVPPTTPPVSSLRAPIMYGALGVLAAAALAVLITGRRLERAPAPPPVVAQAPVPAAPPVAPKPEPEAPVAIHLAVESVTPQARVTLRGRSHALPFAQDLKPGSQPEVVELTAPKREGRRFWITFDRPMTLTAELPPGHGVVDASEVETLVALGEKPTDDAPAADVEHPVSVPARHHRIVGHPTKTTTGAETTDSAPAPKANAPERPSPEEQPAAAALRQPVVKTELSAASKPAPGPALAVGSGQPAAAARAAGLDPAKTQTAVRSHLGEVQRCYERGKMDYPELKGRVTLRISVSAAGAVTSAAVESSSLGSTFVENCIVSAVQDWKFPAPVGGPAVISYPFNLH